MISKHTLTRVSFKSTKKDGTPYEDKNGKPYLWMGLQSEESKGEWMNGPWFDGPFPHREGDRIELDVYEEEYQGKTQLKFRIPKVENPNQHFFEQITNRLSNIDRTLVSLLDEKEKRDIANRIGSPPEPKEEPKRGPLIDPTFPTYPTPEQEDINLDDVPF